MILACPAEVPPVAQMTLSVPFVPTARPTSEKFNMPFGVTWCQAWARAGLAVLADAGEAKVVTATTVAAAAVSAATLVLIMTVRM
jgi:hypothetical protein